MHERIVINKGVKIQYRIRYGEGVPILFLHGGGGSSSVWERIISYVPQKAFLILVDLRGHGFSGRPEPWQEYSFLHHVSDIENIVQAEGLKSVILIGHCMGGMVATMYAARNPQTVRRLVLINVSWTLPWFMRGTLLAPLCRLIAYCSIFVSKPIKKGKRVDYGKFIHTFDFSPKRLIADLLAMGVGAVSRQYTTSLSWDGTAYFPTIACPTLFIAGKYDRIFPVWYSDSTVKLISHCTYVMLPTNHLSVLNHPSELYDTIRTFLAYHEK